MIHFSLRMKSVLLFILFTSAVSVFIYWYFPAELQKQALRSINSKAAMMTDMAAMELRSGMLFDDSTALVEYVQELGKLQDLVYAVVQDTTLKTLVSYNEKHAHELDYQSVLHGRMSATEEVYQTTAPIVYKGRILGRLYLGVSVHQLHKDILQTKQTIAWVSLCVFLIGSVVVLFISQIVTRTLHKLRETFDKIASGNFSERADVQSHDELGMLALGFNSMAEKVQLALQKERDLHMLKTRFISTVSHEFRTPLTSIGLSADLLLSYHTRMSREERLEQVRKIKQRVADLTVLISDFLEQSAASSLREVFSPVPVNVSVLVGEVATSMAVLLSAKQMNIEVVCEPELPVIQGDPRLLLHVVRNLLSNAIKYSPVASTIQCTLRRVDTALELQVSDHGIGIPAKEINKLFTPFFRASNSMGTQGTGLGLSIVKEFVELHGGSVSVQSSPEQGTIFTVLLPLPPTA